MARTQQPEDLQGVIRLVDAHQHFLGLLEGGEIFVYCRRCKKFLLVVLELDATSRRVIDARQSEGV